MIWTALYGTVITRSPKARWMRSKLPGATATKRFPIQAEVPKKLFEIGLDGYVFAAGAHIIYQDQNLLLSLLNKEQIIGLYEYFEALHADYIFEGTEKAFLNRKDSWFSSLEKMLGSSF